MRRTAVVVGAIAVSAYACSGGKPEGSTQNIQAIGTVDSAAAVSLVQRFVNADLATRSDTAWAMLYNCTAEPVADYLAPVLEARVLGVASKGDTTKVTVRYLVLGTATSEDPQRARVATEYWHFKPDVRPETQVFPVIRAPGGRPMIDCGYFPPNHALADSMSDEVTHMDPLSREKWMEALTAAKTLR